MTEGTDQDGNPIDYEEYQEQKEREGCRNGILAAIASVFLVMALLVLVDRCGSNGPVVYAPPDTPTPASQAMSYIPPTITAAPPTITVGAPPQVASTCIQAPTPLDPIGGKSTEVKSLVLEWRSGQVLKPGEFYDVLVSTNASELMGAKPNSAPSLGRTIENKLMVDELKWKYVGALEPTLAGPTPVGPTKVGPTPVGPTLVGPTKVGPTKVGGPTPVGPTPVGPTKVGPTPVVPTLVALQPGATKMFWTVRILGSDGTYRDCMSEPSVFVLLPSGLPPPPAVACVAPPVLFDPPDGKTFWARNTVLRWRSDYELKADEVYAAYIWPESEQDKTRLATTRDRTVPIDLMQWQYKGWVGKFLWDVRIERTDGALVSCEHPPLAFVMTAPPESDGGQGQPAQPGKPQGPIGVPVFPCGGPSCQ